MPYKLVPRDELRKRIASLEAEILNDGERRKAAIELLTTVLDGARNVTRVGLLKRAIAILQEHPQC